MPAKQMKNLSWAPDYPDTGGWRTRHFQAVTLPRGPEIAIVHAIKAWLQYAARHYERYDCEIGDDGLLGPAWEKWGRALYVLLNGETGRLDCGTLGAVIKDNLVTQGFEYD